MRGWGVKRGAWSIAFLAVSCANPRPTPIASSPPDAGVSPVQPTPPSPAIASGEPKAAPLPPAEQPPPAEKITYEEGMLLQGEACLSCHSIELISTSRLGEAGWKAEVVKMKNWGALVEDRQVAPLAFWLSVQYSPTDPAPAAPRISPAKAIAAVAPTTRQTVRGDPQLGATLYQSACASCHGADAFGLGGGPVLVENPALYQPARFAELIHRGAGRMPAFPDFKPAQINAVLSFLQSLPGTSG
ncbi:MAG TPA: cytochrome c [Myxococcaceae bacterium]|nr:cytochrome c [Myxococcaceae bacterium]